jgi:septal ring factor EnvC (AmiA/AmiB activator)
MTRANRALAVVVVACLGLWGCAQGPTNGAANAERLRSLETKHAKLEDDFRAATAARDQLRKKLASAEEQRAQLQQQVEQIQPAVQERDQLKTELTARIGERDGLQAQFDQFRKGIRSLLGQVEASTVKPAANPVTSTPATVQGPRL